MQQSPDQSPASHDRPAQQCPETHKDDAIWELKRERHRPRNAAASRGGRAAGRVHRAQIDAHHQTALAQVFTGLDPQDHIASMVGHSMAGGRPECTVRFFTDASAEPIWPMVTLSVG
jgi:hypothetical protein